jgi:pectinesterase
MMMGQESHLHSIANPNGAVTAQRRGATSQDSGFSFVLCAVTGSGNIFLGRAWGPSSRAVFALTFLDDVVLPKGWSDWSDAARQK